MILEIADIRIHVLAQPALHEILETDLARRGAQTPGARAAPRREASRLGRGVVRCSPEFERGVTMARRPSLRLCTTSGAGGARPSKRAAVRSRTRAVVKRVGARRFSGSRGASQ